MKYSKKTYWITAGAFVLIALLILVAIFYSKGFRFDLHRSLNAVSLIRPGELVISGLESKDRVLVDGKEIPITVSSSTATISLSMGEHQIIISRSGAFPYAKTLWMNEREGVQLRPFLLPQIPLARSVRLDNAEGRSLRDLIVARKVPTEANPRRSDDPTGKGDVVVAYATGTSIIAVWNGSLETTPRAFCTGDTESGCGRFVEVTKLTEPLDGLEFYPGRNDVLIISTDGDIYAIELDKQPIQNFQPIYTSEKKALFMAVPQSTGIFILGTSTLLGIELPQ